MVLVVFAVAFGGLVLLTVSGTIAPWSGRFYSLWDTGYAKIHIPIIASVSEHQPTAWPAFFFDLNMLIWLFPAGVYMCFRNLKDEQVFIVIYAVLASYFAGVMVRLMLTLTPIVCVAAAMALSQILDTFLVASSPAKPDTAQANGQPSANGSTSLKDKLASAIPETLRSTKSPVVGIYSYLSKSVITGAITSYLLLFVLHCTWVTSNAYSSPSVVLASRLPDGSQHIIDDYREAYYWLRQNTAPTAKVMSWWDYGYQIGGMADRPTLVDNNTWNNTHIATVGKAMSSREEVSYPIMRQHEVDYVLVVFGGLLGYSGDDINKFLWMVRIAEGKLTPSQPRGKPRALTSSCRYLARRSQRTRLLHRARRVPRRRRSHADHAQQPDVQDVVPQLPLALPRRPGYRPRARQQTPRRRARAQHGRGGLHVRELDHPDLQGQGLGQPGPEPPGGDGV